MKDMTNGSSAELQPSLFAQTGEVPDTSGFMNVGLNGADVSRDEAEALAEMGADHLLRPSYRVPADHES